VLEVTDDKSLPKQQRKLLQIENAPKKSVRAQTIKLADKISNLRSIISSPPSDWDSAQKQGYVAWARRVVDGFTAPNPVLKAEFENTVKRFEEAAESLKATRLRPPTDQQDHDAWQKYRDDSRHWQQRDDEQRLAAILADTSEADAGSEMQRKA
jgi:hypothetical protein